MSKLQQALILQPASELVFNGPFEHPVTTTLKLTNPTNTPVGFKLKTTAPRDYCVRPNSGIVRPNSTTEVSVILHIEPSTEDQWRHKFMVQSAYVSDISQHLEDIWKNIPAKELMETKLRVIFDWGNSLSSEFGEIVSPPNSTETTRTSLSKSDYMKVCDENVKLQDAVAQMEAEMQNLKKQLVAEARKTAAVSDGSSIFGGGMTLLITIIVIFAAICLGIIFRLL